MTGTTRGPTLSKWSDKRTLNIGKLSHFLPRRGEGSEERSVIGLTSISLHDASSVSLKGTKGVGCGDDSVQVLVISSETAAVRTIDSIGGERVEEQLCVHLEQEGVRISIPRIVTVIVVPADRGEAGEINVGERALSGRPTSFKSRVGSLTTTNRMGSHNGHRFTHTHLEPVNEQCLDIDPIETRGGQQVRIIARG